MATKLKEWFEAAKAGLAVITALIAVIGAVAALKLGGGSSALAEAINDEREAANQVAAAREPLVARVFNVVCESSSFDCRSLGQRSFVESSVENAVRLGTRIVVEEALVRSNQPSDLDELLVASTETDLLSSVGGIVRSRIDDKVKDELIVQGDPGLVRAYATAVNGLITARAQKQFLEKRPNLIERPHSWRDPLLILSSLAGGMAVAAFLIQVGKGFRIIRRRANVTQPVPTGGP